MTFKIRKLKAPMKRNGPFVEQQQSPREENSTMVKQEDEEEDSLARENPENN